MFRRLAFLVAILVLVAICLPGWAVDKQAAQKGPPSAEWPHFRGPQGNGQSTETGLLHEWPKDGPSLLWKAGGLGEGYSSLSIADGRIFTMGDRDGSEYVICLKMADGQELWSTKLSDQYRNGNGDGPRCTPSIDGALVYALTPHGDLVCLESANGNEVWRRSLPKDFQGKMHSGWGFSESPLVDGDHVVCTPGGEKAGLVALNKKTGEEIWRCAFPDLGSKGKDGAGYASIVIGNGAGVRQYLQMTGRGVVSVRATDGKFLWGYNNVANHVANIPDVLVEGDHVFCSTGYGAGAGLLKLKSTGDGVDAEEVYFLDGGQLQNHHGGMVMLGDYVYCGHGSNKGLPTCVEWKTGKIVWRDDQRWRDNGSAAVLYADGDLYFRYQGGEMALITATPDGYQEKGVFKIPDVHKPSWSHPVILGGKLYLREQDALFCYNVKK